MTGYDYFTTETIDSSALADLIRAQPTLVGTFLYIDTITDTQDDVEGIKITVRFSEDLSEDDQATLAGVVAAYFAAVPLQFAKATALNTLQDDVQNFIESKYSFRTRMQLMNLYTLAKFDTLPNRAAYVRQGIDWMNVIVAYGVTVATSIRMAASVSAVEAITWDVSGHSGVNPNISLAGAFSINS